MNKHQLAAKIWESANKMRSKIEANEYKDYILGFIFYKYLSDQEIKLLYKNDFKDNDIKTVTEDDADIVKFVQGKIGYFISYENLFSTWVEKGKDFDVSNVRDALSAFSRLISPTHKKVFNGILDTLQTGLSKLGDSSGSQTKAISGLIQLIKDIPMDGRQDYDVLGFIYEYLISMFAANAGKKAGEFYTPHEVSLLMSEIIADHLKARQEIKIYDPTSGSGSLLINIGRSLSKHVDNEDNIKYYAQEIKENTYNLTRMNLIMRGILPDNIVTRNGDTLEEDWPFFDESDPIGTYDPLFVDAVVSNPPYSQAWDPANKENDARYARFGIAPKSKADFAFLLHDLFHLKPDGIMTIVLPHGVLFRGGEEGEIRKNLIENNHIDTVIGLPPNIFFGTGIPTIIIVLKKKRLSNDVLIIDASKGFAKEGKNNILQASDIKKIADTVINRWEIDKYSRVVTQKEIRENDYNLNIPRYVDSSESNETWDVYASMFGGIPKNEIADFNEYWNVFKGLKDYLFEDDGSPYCAVQVDDIEKAVKENTEIIQFKEEYKNIFSDFPIVLKSKLLDNMMSLNVSKEEAIISDLIFERLKDIPLVGKYEAYQVLDDNWTKIAVDLEILQTEGFEAAKKVDPNIILKKKDGKEQEIQEGYVGRVLPFELVQQVKLQTELLKVKQSEERLSDIQASYEEIIDSLSEEDKESDVLNDDKTSFADKVINQKIKEEFGTLSKAKLAAAVLDEESFERKVVKVAELLEEGKALKTKVKKDAAELHLHTKTVIENLQDQEIIELLETKWIEPLMVELFKLPDEVTADFIAKLKVLTNKYAVTYAEVAEEIAATKLELAKLMDGLIGNEFDMKGLEEFQKLLRGE